MIDIIVASELDTHAQAFLVRWFAAVSADERRRMVRELREVLGEVEQRCVEVERREAAREVSQ